jgi:hypothetical protein
MSDQDVEGQGLCLHTAIKNTWPEYFHNVIKLVTLDIQAGNAEVRAKIVIVSKEAACPTLTGNIPDSFTNVEVGNIGVRRPCCGSAY